MVGKTLEDWLLMCSSVLLCLFFGKMFGGNTLAFKMASKMVHFMILMKLPIKDCNYQSNIVFLVSLHNNPTPFMVQEKVHNGPVHDTRSTIHDHDRHAAKGLPRSTIQEVIAKITDHDRAESLANMPE